MDRFPREIWRDVFDRLAFNNEIWALRKAASLCRSLTPLAQAGLFRMVTLDTDVTCQRLLCVLEATPRLARYIEHLRIDNRSGSYTLIAFLFLNASGPQLATLLAHVTQISIWSFKFRGNMFNRNISAFFAHFTAVRSLTMCDCAFDSAQGMRVFVSHFRESLRYLALVGVTWEIVEANGLGDAQPKPRLTSFPLLAALKIYDVTHQSFVTWLVHAGMVDRLRSLTIRIAAPQDEHVVHTLLSHVCDTLQHLVFDVSGAYSKDSAAFRQAGTRLVDLSILSRLKSIRLTKVSNRMLLAAVPAILESIPTENSLELIEITGLKIPYLQWEQHRPYLNLIDLTLKRAHFPNLIHLDIQARYPTGLSSSDSPVSKIMSYATERHILCFTLLK